MRKQIAVMAMALCVAGAAASPAKTTPTPSTTLPPDATPEAIVEAQLVAYNRRDLEGFLSFYSDDAVLAKHPNEVTQTGKAEMRVRYQKRFSNPNIRADIVKRITFGNFVIDHERITAPPSTDVIEAVAVYEVRDGKIVRVTFLYK
jgi:hypothetical protein